jgi:hypothetical protein
VKIPAANADFSFSGWLARDRSHAGFQNYRAVSWLIQGVCIKMKTTTLVATFVAASALVFIRPVFAQTGGISPSEISTTMQDSSMDPSFEEPWGDGPALTPAPQQPVQSQPGSMYVPPPPVGLTEPFGYSPITPDGLDRIPPDSMGIAGGGFHPEGGFNGPAGGFRP